MNNTTNIQTETPRPVRCSAWLACPFCGTPEENGYLTSRQCDVRNTQYVHCLSCGAAAPVGVWNLRPPWLLPKDAKETFRRLAAYFGESCKHPLAEEVRERIEQTNDKLTDGADTNV